MKKAMLIALGSLIFVGMSFGQPVGIVNGIYTPNPNDFSTGTFGPGAGSSSYTAGNGLSGIDKLGAHNNGGRGCTGCHAPHSGGQGGGGNTAAGAAAFADPNSGDFALWGQDLTPLYTASGNMKFGDKGGYALAAETSSTTPDGEVTGVLFCLSCHDGNVAKGGMMQGVSYEQANGLLPGGVYGNRPIPTLLGNEGNGATLGNYDNDHPVGPSATLGAVKVSSHLLVAANNTFTIATNDVAYNEFVSMYGAPLFLGRNGLVWTGSDAVGAAPSSEYVVCTTCHTPHTMYVYSGTSAINPIGGNTSGNFPTFFFINAPYNPGSHPAANQASSVTQFCRQCHFSGAGGSNESVGIYGITTAF